MATKPVHPWTPATTSPMAAYMKAICLLLAMSNRLSPAFSPYILSKTKYPFMYGDLGQIFSSFKHVWKTRRIKRSSCCAKGHFRSLIWKPWIRKYSFQLTLFRAIYSQNRHRPESAPIWGKLRQICQNSLIIPAPIMLIYIIRSTARTSWSRCKIKSKNR